jgi:hypothetical protein
MNAISPNFSASNHGGTRQPVILSNKTHTKHQRMLNNILWVLSVEIALFYFATNPPTTSRR